MKKLLFITSQLPYPPTGGGVIVSWNLIKNLSRHFEVSLINVLKFDDRDNEAEFLNKIQLQDYYGKYLDIGRSPATVLKSYLKGVPINFIRNYSDELANKIHESIDQYDFVIVDHYEMFQYIPPKTKAKVILHEHNAEFIMWKRYSELSRNPLKKMVTHMESQRIRKQEEAFCKRADLVLAYPNDREILQSITGGKGRFEEIIPCGDDYMLAFPELDFDKTEPSILYIGSLSWEANRDGLVWFINEAWEKLKARHPETKFYIVGGNPDSGIQALAARHQDIVLTGFVDDLEDYYTKCRVFVSPLRFGSGVKLKVLNSMLRGLPVVTTEIGSEGMPVSHGKELFISDGIDEMVDDASKLLTDKALWDQMRVASREMARTHFSWPKQVEKIKEYLYSLNGEVGISK